MNIKHTNIPCQAFIYVFFTYYIWYSLELNTQRVVLVLQLLGIYGKEGDSFKGVKPSNQEKYIRLC